MVACIARGGGSGIEIELLHERLLTGTVSQLILLALYSILQVLSFATGLLDARLHLVGGDVVRHGVELCCCGEGNWLSS